MQEMIFTEIASIRGVAAILDQGRSQEFATRDKRRVWGRKEVEGTEGTQDVKNRRKRSSV